MNQAFLKLFYDSVRQSWLYRISKNTLSFRIIRYYHRVFYPIRINEVFIETTTICNRKCHYCPNSTVGRPKNLMEQSVFYKIIDSLEEYGFTGVIVPNGYGEPLTDSRLATFIAYIKKKLPSVCVIINTNGDFLTVDRYLELNNAGVNTFMVSKHSKELPTVVTNTLKYIKQNYPEKYSVGVNDTFNSTELMNRGGLVNVKVPKKAECSWANKLTIDYAGNVILCCNDYRSSITFGNIVTV